MNEITKEFHSFPERFPLPPIMTSDLFEQFWNLSRQKFEVANGPLDEANVDYGKQYMREAWDELVTPRLTPAGKN